MSVAETVTSRYLYPKGSPKQRMFALWYFASLITLWTIAGHTFLGWEQSWATPIMAVGAAIIVTLILETVRAWSLEQTPLYLKGPQSVASLLLPALIPGLAVAMLLYPNERLAPIAFASTVAIASKVLIRAPMKGATQHIFNPSNFGIAVTLLLFPWVGIAPPYQFTENARGVFDVILPLIIVCTGFLLNTKFTERIPLILAWLGGFLLAAVVRSVLHGTPVAAALAPMTGLAFVLFTFYMVTDPGTTPSRRGAQIVFGGSVAMVYGLLVSAHVVFGLFFSLTIVTAIRGALMYMASWRAAADLARAEPPAAAASGRMT